MYNILLTIYIIICIALVFLVLIQSGRGGGLVESFSSAESIFGTKTNKYMVRMTAVLATLFFSFTILIAYLSKQKSKSLIDLETIPEKPIESISQELPAEPGDQPEGEIKKQAQEVIEKAVGETESLEIPNTTQPKEDLNVNETKEPIPIPTQPGQ